MYNVHRRWSGYINCFGKGLELEFLKIYNRLNGEQWILLRYASGSEDRAFRQNPKERIAALICCEF